MKTTHELKCWPEYFGPVVRGEKTFEIRKEDRVFHISDWVWLREWSPDTKKHTGMSCIRRITYILDGGQFGIEPGYVVLGLAIGP
jgi:hypothetical protein